MNINSQDIHHTSSTWMHFRVTGTRWLEIPSYRLLNIIFVLYYQKRIPAYHQVSSLKKASKLHPGYNVYPISIAFEQLEHKAKYIDLPLKCIDWMSKTLCWIYMFWFKKIKTIRSLHIFMTTVFFFKYR